MAVNGLPPRIEIPRALFMTRFMLHPDKLLDEAYRDYGDFFHFVTPLERTMCVTANPETIQQVFRGDPEIFRAGEGNATLAPLVGPHSTLLLDGAEHLRHRKLLLPPFHGERMREYGELMAEVAERHVSAWPKDRAFSAIESTQAITLEVIQRAVFGIEDGRQLDHVARLLRAVLDPMTSRWQMLVLMLAPSSWGPLSACAPRTRRSTRRSERGAPTRPRPTAAT
jgi:cytochrome P450